MVSLTLIATTELTNRSDIRSLRVKATVPKVQEGLKAAALMPESGTNEKAPAHAMS